MGQSYAEAGGPKAARAAAAGDATTGAHSAATKAAIAARRPLIRPPLASPRGIILTHNIQPSLTWGSLFAQRPGLRMGCSQLLLHAPCGPRPTGPKTTRIQGC